MSYLSRGVKRKMTAVQLVAILSIGLLAMASAVAMAIYMMKVSEHSE